MKKTFLFTVLCSLFVSEATAQDIYVNIENDAVHDYMSDVCYAPEDTSVVLDYTKGRQARLDIPRPAVIPVPPLEADTITIQYVATESLPTTIGIPKGTTEALVYNLLPNNTYRYRIIADEKTVAEGEIVTTGQVRMVYTPHGRNIRDLGGWPCAGNKTIKYGRLFRGAELNGVHTSDSTDLDILTNQIGIASELDMRAWYNEDNGVTVFGFLNASQAGAWQAATYYYTSNSGQLPEDLTTYSFQYRWRREFEFIVNNLKQQRPVYMHCANGANRTGYLACLLEGLLGVGYSDLIKDYELTTFSKRTETKEKIEPVIEFINNLEGETLQDKFNSYFINYLSVKQTDIDYFRSVMLEENTTTGISVTEHDNTIKYAYDLLGRRVNYEKNKHYRSCLQRGTVVRSIP